MIALLLAGAVGLAQPEGAGARGARPEKAPVAEPTTTSADLERRLAEIDAKAAAIKDLTADFEQRKKTPLLKKPMVSSGTVRVKGTRTRWDTAEPHATVMTIDPVEMRIYYPEQKTVEVYPIDAGMSRLASSPLPRIAVIREQFTVAETPAREVDAGAKAGDLGLELTPIEEALKEHVERVRVVVDPATGFARTVEVTDADGEVTTMTFRNVRTGTGLKDEELALRVPAGTKVSRPLQGQGARPAEDEKGRREGEDR